MAISKYHERRLTNAAHLAWLASCCAFVGRPDEGLFVAASLAASAERREGRRSLVSVVEVAGRKGGPETRGARLEAARVRLLKAGPMKSEPVSQAWPESVVESVVESESVRWSVSESQAWRRILGPRQGFKAERH